MSNFKHHDGLIERIYWLIRLRWIAVIGVVATVLFVEKAVGLSLPVFPLYSIAALLGAYNLVFFIWIKSVDPVSLRALDISMSRAKQSLINRIANTQIALDLLSLTALIHFSGGIENPFIFYFIFHMIIASILLSRRASFLQATFTIFLFNSVVFLEYAGLLPHYCLKGFVPYTLHGSPLYIFGMNFAFISTVYIAVYLAASISGRLRERERSLKEANILLEEKDRIKSEYVLRVSHDIKEHLSAIQGCLGPVRTGITGELNPKQRDLIERADDRTDKLMSFVRALLEITRIKLSRQIEMGMFSLRETVEDAIDLVEARAKDKNISINVNIEPDIDKINGAQIYIEETIANLLANSVKYTPNGGRVDIAVKNKGDSVLLQIADTGIGIPKDEIPKLFEEFFRARNAKKIERTGTGLGLSIAKQVIERHNGRIWVESEEGRGSTFSILLPK